MQQKQEKVAHFIKCLTVALSGLERFKAQHGDTTVVLSERNTISQALLTILKARQLSQNSIENDGTEQAFQILIGYLQL